MEPTVGELKPGGGVRYHQFEEPDARILKTFPPPKERAGVITFTTREVTALCPLTGQPDYYTVMITYEPNTLCIESKSAKLYFGAYRQQKGFIESLAYKVLSDWVEACRPEWAEIVMTMAPRGGIAISVTYKYKEYKFKEGNVELI